MARSLSQPRVGSRALAGRSLPSWVRVLMIYALSRLVSTTFLAVIFTAATQQHWTFASYRANPDFFTFSGSWDASFYRQIALHGYPAELPLDATGNVQPNVWAFLPVFPWLARAVMAVSGLNFYVAGVLVALLCGAGAAVVLHRMLLPRVGETAALWAVILFCFGPVSFVLQIAYAESLFLLLAFGSLAAMLARRYLLLIPLALVAAFTRPGVIALALALGVHFLVRLFGRDPFPWRDRITSALAGALIAVAGLAWPVIASVVTGHDNAYLETELSWWTGFVGHADLVPLTPWFLMASRYVGAFGIVLVVGLIAGFVWWLSRRSLRALGHELIAFGASYGLYLVAVFLPQQSLFRLLLPLSPLLGDPAISRNPAVRTTLLVAGIALQPVAIALLWFLGYP